VSTSISAAVRSKNEKTLEQAEVEEAYEFPAAMAKAPAACLVGETTPRFC
jgi:hypothetical protein